MTLTPLNSKFGRSGNPLFADEHRVVKGTPNEWERVFMSQYPDVFPDVKIPDDLSGLPGGYFYHEMPRYLPYRVNEGAYPVFAGLQLLKKLWVKPFIPGNSEWPSLLFGHLRKLTYETIALELVDTAYLTKPRPALIHGDPTLANLVSRRFNGRREWRYVDPLRRDYVPDDAHVDLGKLFQSACGYEGVIDDKLARPHLNFMLMRFLSDEAGLDYRCGLAWMIIHFIRLTKYQDPASAKLFMQFAESAYVELLQIPT